MALYTKESLDLLRQRINLIEALSPHIDLKRAGASYKALCPFHDEKTPSFVVQNGDTHYHCFGCGAHGDAIQFLMSYLKMNFSAAVQTLAEKFHVHLQTIDKPDADVGPNKAALKGALEAASHFYHFYLLHTPEGHEALQYLYNRHIDLDFIRQFNIGLAPRETGLLRKLLHTKFISDDIMAEAGLINPIKDGRWRDFFQERITFPICDASGAVIGFSARKYKEATFGGKYINTPETPLFKKSRVLFGLNYSRRRIAKERKAIIVEGQIDALRLIAAGFNITVAGQGTAFGESHAKELIALGINEVYLALDADFAGQQAACKIGDLFQREGIDVRVIALPAGNDPDVFLREHGPEKFLAAMDSAVDYLTFLVKALSVAVNPDSPAGKNQLVHTIVKQIRQWNQPVMVHESLKKLARLLQVPESMIGASADESRNIYIKRHASIGLQAIDGDKILESDFLRWLILKGQDKKEFIDRARQNIKPEDLHVPVCSHLYQKCLDCHQSQSPFDLLSIGGLIENLEAQELLSELLLKKINIDKANDLFNDTIQKILTRNWMQEREDIKMKMINDEHNDDNITALSKKFDSLKRTPPQIQM